LNLVLDYVRSVAEPISASFSNLRIDLISISRLNKHEDFVARMGERGYLSGIPRPWRTSAPGSIRAMALRTCAIAAYG
jgi:hypothetical protein